MFKEVRKIKYKKEYIDPLKPLKNIATDFVNDNFLKYNDNQINLIKTLYFYIQPIVDKYNSYLIYKGGNVLRLVNNNIIKYFPPNSNEIIKAIFEPFLKQSDNDFTIYLNSDIDNYEKKYINLMFDVFGGLDKVRNHILKNKSAYFDIYTLNDNQINHLFDNFKNELQKEVDFKLLKVKLKPKHDELITFVDKNDIKKGTLIFNDISRRKNIIYNNINFSLEFSNVKNKIIKFGLLRSKINFSISQKSNIGSELIDVSIPHKDDRFVKDINTTKKYNHFIKNNIEKINNFGFNYYIINFEYIIDDLYRIIFIDIKYPWQDEKYKKRVSRLIYFIFLDEINKHTISIKSLNKISDNFNYFIYNLDSNNPQSNIFLLDEIITSLNEIENNINKNSKILFIELIKILIYYANAVIMIIDEIKNYMMGKVKFNKKSIYNLNIN